MSYDNPFANLGINNGTNLSSQWGYSFDRLSLNRQLLHAMYRSSWVVGLACDAIADDMTRAGVEIQSTMEPGAVKRLESTLDQLALWPRIAEAIRWGRLYGGAILVPVLDGQDFARPFVPASVGRGMLRGFAVLDRWQLISSVWDLQPFSAEPNYYDTVPDGVIPPLRIHHSRVFRFRGFQLPYWEKRREMSWDASIIERIHDRLVSYDQVTTGVAQLANKAHLRILKTNLRDMRSQAGTNLWDKFMQRISEIRLFQSNEGITVLDHGEEMEHFTNSFSGLDNILQQFGTQLWGALEIPEVRALGKSANGLNASDEWALKNYYGNIQSKQESILRSPLTKILNIASLSEFGVPLPEDFTFEFRSLNIPDPEKMASMAQIRTATTLSAYESGLISERIALKELKQQESGAWTNITDEDIAQADEYPRMEEGGNNSELVRQEAEGNSE